MKPFLWFVLVLRIICGNAGSAEPDSSVPAGQARTPANLPIIYLQAQQPIRSEVKVPCRLLMKLPGGDPVGPVRNGVVRYHGASSQGYPKKSYSVTLASPVSWLALPESAHWVLNAAAVDPSLMRHKLSYDLFQSLTTPGAPRRAVQSRFVEVVVGGRYEGAYLLMQGVNRTMLHLQRFESNAPSHAVVFKAVDHAAGFDHEGHDGFRQIEPEPIRGEYWKPLDDLMRFASTSSRRAFLDPETGIGSRLDLDNAIDFHLLILLTCNMDGFDKNLILARDAVRPNAPAPRFFFVPWDYDATFGENWEGSPVSTREWLSNHLFDRLLADSSYAKRFGTRWKELRRRQFSEQSIDGLIDENAATLGPAAGRDALRWGRSGGANPSAEFQTEVTRMKRWTAARLTFLDREIAQRSVR